MQEKFEYSKIFRKKNLVINVSRVSRLLFTIVVRISIFDGMFKYRIL